MRATEREWKRVIIDVLDDRSVRGVASHDHMGIVTAQEMVSRIRRAMAADLPTDFRGTVEADETYMGPKWHNRKRSDLGKTKRGRGTDNLPVFGIIEPKRKLVYAVVVPSVKGKDLLPVIKEHVRKRTMVYTDTSTSYRRLRQLGFRHESVDHVNWGIRPWQGDDQSHRKLLGLAQTSAQGLRRDPQRSTSSLRRLMDMDLQPSP